MKQKLSEIVHATVSVFIYFDKIRKTKQLWAKFFFIFACFLALPLSFFSFRQNMEIKKWNSNLNHFQQLLFHTFPPLR